MTGEVDRRQHLNTGAPESDPFVATRLRAQLECGGDALAWLGSGTFAQSPKLGWQICVGWRLRACRRIHDCAVVGRHRRLQEMFETFEIECNAGATGTIYTYRPHSSFSEVDRCLLVWSSRDVVTGVRRLAAQIALLSYDGWTSMHLPGVMVVCWCGMDRLGRTSLCLSRRRTSLASASS